MKDRHETREPAEKRAVTVRVEPSSSTQLPVGSRLEVVDSTLDSLWGGPYTVTLRRIDDTPQ